jgi:hypothetical protein
MPKSPQVLHLVLETAHQRKGDPQSGSLRFASGNLRCSTTAGSRANSPAAQTSAIPDPPTSALLGPARTGQSGSGTKDKYKQGHTMACPCFFRYSVLVSGCLVFLLPAPTPCGCAEERRSRRIRDRDCLSGVKRSEFERDPAWTEHRRLPVAKRRDAATRVAFSFAYFSFGEAKEK